MTSRETIRQTSRLFIALEYGEQLACQCAHHQASLINQPLHRRFLRSQARQEAFHASFFKRAITFLDVDRQYAVPTTLKSFGIRLDNALQRGDIIETLVGQQIVLESFGAAILARLNNGMDKQGIGLRCLRRMILAQEQSHYAFGESVLQRQLLEQATDSDTLLTLSKGYIELVQAMLEEMHDIFYCLDEDPDDYMTDLLDNLPNWLTGADR